MKLIRRDYRRGDLLTIHGTDGASVQGAYLRGTRRYLQVEKYAIEAGGELRSMKGDRLLVPRSSIRLVEVVEL